MNYRGSIWTGHLLCIVFACHAPRCITQCNATHTRIRVYTSAISASSVVPVSFSSASAARRNVAIFVRITWIASGSRRSGG